MPHKGYAGEGGKGTGRSKDVSSVRKDDVVAILCADIHLSHKPPLARTAEPNWYAAMARSLRQLRDMSFERNVPVVCAGDIFDRWNSPSELVNFALGHLPDMYAIPGQHDLPYHSYKDIKKTSFWTLVRAGKVKLIDPAISPVEVEGKAPVRLWGFPWGFDLKPCKQPHDLAIDVAVVHSYLWTAKVGGYPGAPKENRLGNHKEKLQGYDVAVWGDNHVPFDAKSGKCRVFNVGGFQRRKMDEKDHEPSVGLLHADGSVSRHYLDCADDKFIDPEKNVELLQGIGAETLIEELTALGQSAIDFREAVVRLLEREKVADGVKRIILGHLEVEK